MGAGNGALATIGGAARSAVGTAVDTGSETVDKVADTGFGLVGKTADFAERMINTAANTGVTLSEKLGVAAKHTFNAAVYGIGVAGAVWVIAKIVGDINLPF